MRHISQKKNQLATPRLNGEGAARGQGCHGLQRDPAAGAWGPGVQTSAGSSGDSSGQMTSAMIRSQKPPGSPSRGPVSRVSPPPSLTSTSACSATYLSFGMWSTDTADQGKTPRSAHPRSPRALAPGTTRLGSPQKTAPTVTTYVQNQGDSELKHKQITKLRVYLRPKTKPKGKKPYWREKGQQ